jgi:hypothetical protein
MAAPRSAVKEVGSAMKPSAIFGSDESPAPAPAPALNADHAAHGPASTAHKPKAHPSKLPITASKLSANKAAKQLAIEKAKHPHAAAHHAVPARYLAPTQAAEARKKDIKNSHIPIATSAAAAAHANAHRKPGSSRIPSASTAQHRAATHTKQPPTTQPVTQPTAAMTTAAYDGFLFDGDHDSHRNEEILRAVEACEQVANDAVDVALHHHRHHHHQQQQQLHQRQPASPSTTSPSPSSSSLMVSSPLQVDTAMLLSSSSMMTMQLSSSAAAPLSLPLTRMESLDRRINLSRSGAISPVMGQVEEMDNVSFQESIDCTFSPVLPPLYCVALCCAASLTPAPCVCSVCAAGSLAPELGAAHAQGPCAGPDATVAAGATAATIVVVGGDSRGGGDAVAIDVCRGAGRGGVGPVGHRRAEHGRVDASVGVEHLLVRRARVVVVVP